MISKDPLQLGERVVRVVWRKVGTVVEILWPVGRRKDCERYAVQWDGEDYNGYFDYTREDLRRLPIKLRAKHALVV